MSDGRVHNGGARPGAGRKPKPVEDAQQSVLFELFDEAEERAVVLNMLTIAKRKGPLNATSAISAATWLWDRKYGKPIQRQEHSGPDGGPIEALYIDYRNGIAGTKTGPIEDSDTPSES